MASGLLLAFPCTFYVTVPLRRPLFWDKFCLICKVALKVIFCCGYMPVQQYVYLSAVQGLLQKCSPPQYICMLFPAHDVTEMLPTSVLLYVVSSPYFYRNVSNLSPSVCCFQPMLLLQKCCPPQYICVLFPAHDAHGGQRFYQHMEPTSAVQPNWWHLGEQASAA